MQKNRVVKVMMCPYKDPYKLHTRQLESSQDRERSLFSTPYNPVTDVPTASLTSPRVRYES